MDIHADRLLILDFGSQYTQLIARRVREIGVFRNITLRRRSYAYRRVRPEHCLVWWSGVDDG